MRSKVFKILSILMVVTGLLVMSALLTKGVTTPGTKMTEGSGALVPANTARGQYAEAYQKHELIRFHVIANSDSEQDQALKRKIRDLIVQQMTPEFAKAENISEARAVAREHLAEIKAIAAKEVKVWGKSYPVSVQLGRFEFPIKSYGDVTLPAGNYEAVRVVLGRGQGANWWCVLFPPLCFVDVSRSFAPQDINPGPDSQSLSVSGTKTESRAVRTKQGSAEVPRVKTVKPVAGSNSQPVYQVRFKVLELLGW